jgi:hypothetical protein
MPVIKTYIVSISHGSATIDITHIDKIYTHCSLIMKNKIQYDCFTSQHTKTYGGSNIKTFMILFSIFMFSTLGYHLNDLLTTIQPLSPTTFFLNFILSLNIILI